MTATATLLVRGTDTGPMDHAAFLDQYPGGYDPDGADRLVTQLGQRGLCRTGSEVVGLPYVRPTINMVGSAALAELGAPADQAERAARVTPAVLPDDIEPLATKADHFEQGLQRIDDNMQPQPGDKEAKKASIWGTAVGIVAISGTWAYIEMMQRTSNGQVGKVFDLLFPFL